MPLVKFHPELRIFVDDKGNMKLVVNDGPEAERPIFNISKTKQPKAYEKLMKLYEKHSPADPPDPADARSAAERT